jgi:hypothetical protein
MACFSFLSLFRCLFAVQWDFCLGIIPVHALCVNQCNPLSTALPHPFPLLCVAQQLLGCFIVSYSNTNTMFFHYYSLSFFPSFPPPLVSSTSPIFWVLHVLYIFICIYYIEENLVLNSCTHGCTCSTERLWDRLLQNIKGESEGPIACFFKEKQAPLMWKWCGIVFMQLDLLTSLPFGVLVGLFPGKTNDTVRPIFSGS